MRLTRPEIILLTAFFLAIAVGVVAKHYRDAHQLSLPRVEPSPKPGNARRTPPAGPKEEAAN
ncbi:MAG TPA: hypothetical protein VGH90_07390 [Chthoniobacteraceae bacterium]|jgi:hypothetical protein